MIKVVLFDYGHTLMQVKKKDKEMIIEKFGLTEEEYKNGYEIYLIYSRGRINSDEQYLKQCSNFIGKPVTKEFLDAIHEIEIIDEKTIELIKKLKKKYKLAIIANNVKSWVLGRLEKHGIRNYFDAIVASSEIGIRKPDPRIFTFALNKLKVNPKECIFISDELNDDLAGAKVLGIKTVWLKNSEEKITFQPDYTIKSLNEIMEILK